MCATAARAGESWRHSAPVVCRTIDRDAGRVEHREDGDRAEGAARSRWPLWNPRTSRACAASSARWTSCPCSPTTGRRCRSARSSDSTGLAKTTVLRLVQTLEQSGLLWATANGYMAGPGLWRWAHLAQRSWELPPETQRSMRELAGRHRETVNVYVARDIYRVCIAQQESPQPLRHVVHVGDELPMWAGASAKVLLRDADRDPARPDRPQLALRAPPCPSGCRSGSTRRPRRATRSATASGRTGSPPSPCRSSAGPEPSSPRWPERPDRPLHRRAASREFAADLKRVAQHMSERGFDHPLGTAT